MSAQPERVVLVTGGSRGIGLACARRFQDDGDRVAVTFRTKPPAGRARWTLEVGQHADIVVFDAATVRDTASYEAPATPAEGITAVIVNGAVTWERGSLTGASAGTVLRS